MNPWDEDLESMRPRMMSVAYRMLGTVADAEDVVQEAYLRLYKADEVVSAEGFLIRTTTNLCIDRLRVRQRIEYIGPWVPEPIDTSGQESSLADSLTQAFLLMLERLSPEERAAFLLREVFDYEYTEISGLLEKSEAATRQLVSRARGHLDVSQTRHRVTTHHADRLAQRFIEACRLGDIHEVEAMMTADIAIHSDGGGKASAARVVIHGPQRAARFMTGIFRKQRELAMRRATVNGEPGLVFLSQGKPICVMSVHVEDEIRGVYLTRNPDKLARWSEATIE